MPLCVFFGVLAAFGAPTLTWASAFGMWLYSFVRPMSILVKDAEAPVVP